jgi:phosphoglycolate phosphatase/pyrophosphatase PpaX
LGRSPSDEEIYAHFGPSEEGMFQHWVPDHWELCVRQYLIHYEQEHRRIGRVFSGVERTLETLRVSGIPMAIVTGKGAHSAAISMDQLGLTPYFDVVETGSPRGNVKRQAIQNVLSRWGIDVSHVAYLGDAVSDIEVAHGVGVLPLAAAWEPRADVAALQASQPHAIFRTVPEFHAWITTRLPPVP